jgi:glycosyltransferase involved in cell wall biosynthesis
VADGVDVALTLVGDGPMRTSLQARAAELGIADRVEMAGPVPSESVPSVLADADLYVQPSRREGFGLALVEALATGLPAVATRSGGPEEIVGGSDGVLVVPGDSRALAEGIRDAIGRRASFDGAAIADRMAERYSRHVVGERLAQVYERVVESGTL